ncbi:hypothetical protein GQ600_23239 [Phytophthora cactorum]|nr:hypothetical protein GQ600_23239 [Phytophthora cactorum]
MLANGSMSKVTDTVERLTGRKPLGYKENLLQYKEIFPKNHWRALITQKSLQLFSTGSRTYNYDFFVLDTCSHFIR